MDILLVGITFTVYYIGGGGTHVQYFSLSFPLHGVVIFKFTGRVTKVNHRFHQLGFLKLPICALLYCSRYTAYKLLYYHIHGRAKVSQARRDRTVLPNCVGRLCSSNFFFPSFYLGLISDRNPDQN